MSNLLTFCSNCQSLKNLLDKIDTSLYKRIKGKWTNVIYGTDVYFNEGVYTDLVRYKSILQKKIINPSYPDSRIDTQDIIGKITLLINK